MWQVSLFGKKAFSTARKRSLPHCPPLKDSGDSTLVLGKSPNPQGDIEALSNWVLGSLSISPPAALLSLHRGGLDWSLDTPSSGSTVLLTSLQEKPW